MRKLTYIPILTVLVFLFCGIYFFTKIKEQEITVPISDTVKKSGNSPKVLEVFLLADSHNSNDMLQLAVDTANLNTTNYTFVLGDVTNVGTEAELTAAKKVIDTSVSPYYIIPGDHEYYVSEWDGRESIVNFTRLFGQNAYALGLCYKNNSYSVIKFNTSGELEEGVSVCVEFIFVHEPLYPLGKNLSLLGKVRESNIKAVFSGDTHFSSKNVDPKKSTLMHYGVGALASDRNLQTPRYSILRIFENGEYSVEVVEVQAE